jgi:DNA-binding XRE family transcriptional regulator
VRLPVTLIVDVASSVKGKVENNNIPFWNTGQERLPCFLTMSRYTGSSEQRRLRHLLRQVRIEAGLRQGDLAAKLKQSQSFISKYESGEIRLDLLELQNICRAVGLSLSEFVVRFEGTVNEAKQEIPKSAKTLLGKRQKR